MAASNKGSRDDTVKRWGLAPLRGILVWITIGTVAALQVISGPHLIAGAIWFIPRIVRVAAVIGACHGLWLEAERGRGPWRSHPVLMGGVTGSITGLLGVLPACTIHGVPVLLRSALAGYVAASGVGGFCAGAALAYFAHLGDRAASRPWSAWRVVAPVVACTLIAGVEVAALGPAVATHLLPPPLSAADVRDIGPGSARGTGHSGFFRLDAIDADGTFKWRCLATVVQRDGMLSVACFGDHTYTGAVNTDGRFRIGGTVISPGSGASTMTELELLTGQFLTDTTLDVTVQAQVAPGHANQTVYLLWRGHGRKCAGVDVESCADHSSGRP